MTTLLMLTLPALILAWLAGLFSIFGVTLILGAMWILNEARRQGFARFFHPRNLLRTLLFLWDFAVDLTVSNLVLAWDVLTPRDLHKVSLILVPVDDLTPREIVLLSLRITLTPGTLACDLTESGNHLLVHAMYATDKNMAQLLRKPLDRLKGRS